MLRFLPWVLVAVAITGFGWAYERVNTISSRVRVLSIKVDGLNETVRAENNRIQVRTFAIKSQLAQTDSPIVFVGDSLTEGALLPTQICGHQVVNAGIGGMRAASYADLAKELFSPIFLVVIAVGTNDATPNNGSFRENYEALIDAIPAQKRILVGAPAMEDSTASRAFDAKQLEVDNRIISEIATARHIPYVAPEPSEGPNTVDGIHLSRKGYQRWLSPIFEAVAVECTK